MGSLTLWDVRVVDVESGDARDGMQIEVSNGIIEGVREADAEAPAGAIDAGGRTAIPGLVDAHFHFERDGIYSIDSGLPPRLEGEAPRPKGLSSYVMAKTAGALLDAGITTARDIGSYGGDALRLREAIRLGIVDGPRILSCGRIITATAPGKRIFHSMYDEADGPDGMRRAVRKQLRRGADFVKLMATGARSVVREDPERAQMTAIEAAAIVDEAHRMGVRVAAHAEGLEGTRLAIEQGVDTIEHGFSLHRSPELLDEMASRGIVLVPTLSTFHDLSERFPTSFPTVLIEQAKRQRAEAYETIVVARDAGVTIAMGFDSGPPGANATELSRMVKAGLTTAEGIRAATVGSAQALGIEDEVGTIKPGKSADLLILDGDPLTDIDIVLDPRRVWLTVHDGKLVGGRAMDPGLLAAAPA